MKIVLGTVFSYPYKQVRKLTMNKLFYTQRYSHMNKAPFHFLHWRRKEREIWKMHIFVFST